MSSPSTPPIAAIRSPNPAELPARMNRRDAAAFLTHNFFPISPRTLEAAPLMTRRVNGKALYETTDLIAYAEQKLDAAAPTRGGRRHHA